MTSCHRAVPQTGPRLRPASRPGALALLEDSRGTGELITGLLYLDQTRPTLPETHHLPELRLDLLPEEMIRPSKESLDGVMAGFA